AEAHVAKGQYERASQVLERLIQREPQNAQHRNKLQFVKSQMGGVDTIPAKQKSVEQPLPPPSSSMSSSMSMEIEEPAPSFNFEEPSPSFDLDLDSSPALELDFSAIPEPAPPPPPPAPAAPSRLAPAVEIAAADLSGNESDDLDFITEHLTEAEVFAKYGLAEKAAEHLRSVLERAPSNLTAHERLYKILLDEGDVDAARGAALALVDLLMENGDDDAIAAVNNEFLARGHALAPQAKAAPVSAPAFEPEPEPEIEAAEEELSFDLDSTPSEFEIDSVSTSSVADFAPPQEETIEFADLSAEVEEEPELPTEEPFFGIEASTSLGPTAEEIGEVDFYIGQELYDEARERLDALAARFPDDPDVETRRAKIDAAAVTPAPPPPPATKTAPGTLSRDEIESELLSAIPDDDEEIAAPAPPPPQPAAPPIAQAAPAIAEENLFADEDDFFDLAAELESELNEEEEPIALSEEEQSLEEIFKEFKKGVEQQLDSEDYDTHYNLGIAYKEMGLTDEAIGEFQLASKDPKRSVECASMLGLCFLEKGMPQLAIKWYRKGLEMPEINEEEHVGLLYDLGNAYVEVGDTQNAQKAFMEVYGMNTNYRDVVSRIKQLEGAT
ncbi:MAG TPA: hypothetical protein VGR95_04335, partial [Thermoanaerobaculia bacterium]|nr:hypothetical protein [Thermoanaerobaculia bacterium]